MDVFKHFNKKLDTAQRIFRTKYIHKITRYNDTDFFLRNSSGAGYKIQKKGIHWISKDDKGHLLHESLEESLIEWVALVEFMNDYKLELLIEKDGFIHFSPEGKPQNTISEQKPILTKEELEIKKLKNTIADLKDALGSKDKDYFKEKKIEELKTIRDS